MNGKFKSLKVILKQHTPLLHFQPTQDGATLRASEVKPRLDRFLLDNPESGVKCVGDSTSLNYKVKITANGNNLLRYFDKFPLILSNIGKKVSDSDFANFSFYDTVTLEFLGAEDIIDVIDSYVDVFFAFNNFGQRQDKGFGSFSVLYVNEELCYFPDGELPENTHIMTFNLSAKSGLMTLQSQIFQVIDFYWKVLKSGINYTKNRQYPDRYIKSFLWRYLNEVTHTTWEKKKIKETFNLTTGRERRENPNPAYFTRALLGASDKFEYGNKHATVNVTLSDGVDRIPSPVVFKPVVSKGVVNIYVLMNKKVVDELKKLKEIKVTFECNHRTLDMKIIPDVLDINHLLQEYASFLTAEMVTLTAHKEENGFIPVNFKWESVLDSGKCVTLKKL